jgi:NAD(P)-dependent dehydrogenase (short-subunit alcohol dehydrogenase family)
MELGLNGKVVIVTGGSKGIGRAAVTGFIDEGASVFACARGKEALDETVASVGHAARERIDAMPADLTDPQVIKRVVARCIERFGRIDILVNNAGSIRAGDFLKITDEQWQEDLSLKLFGYVRMTREVMPHMIGQKSGVIVNVIGGGGINPRGNYTVGGVGNAALTNFTKSIGDMSAQYGVRSVGINPGPILTERLLQLRTVMNPGEGGEEFFRKITPLGRPGKPEEVADLILFLASDRAAFIHSTNVTIDGGNNKGLMN